MRVTRHFGSLIGCIGLVVASHAQAGQPNASYLAALAAQPARPVVTYQLDLTRPGTHLAQVTLTAPATGAATILEMPVWYPGRYSVFHFAANVQQTSADCASTGKPLTAERQSPHSWIVHNGRCASIQWRYRVYGNKPLDGSFFQLDSAHADLNGGPVFMYVAGEKPNPVRLSIQAPAGWHVLDQLGQVDQTKLWFPSYDILIDSPIEAAPRLDVRSFQVDGKTYRVLIHDFITPARDSAHQAQLLTNLEKIVREENALIAPDDLDTYTFFFHFDTGSYDSMEHLFGAQIVVGSALSTNQGLLAAEGNAAHEFFHQWNDKRIRPVALGPFNYEGEDVTPSLWFAEGFTQYYGVLTMERTGLRARDLYLHILGDIFGLDRSRPGYRLMSAEDSSLTAWFHDTAPLKQETNMSESVISYYVRGEQLAAVLDLDIRARTGGRKNLDDVMRWMWTHTYRAPRTTDYLPGRGYTDLDIEHALDAVTGASYQQFFHDYIRGTQPIPYDHYLAAAGLQLSCTVPAEVTSYTGVHMKGDQITGVDFGSPTALAGLGGDATITAIGGEPKVVDLDTLPPGSPVQVTASEHGASVEFTLTPEPPRSAAASCRLTDLPAATPQQLALQNAWLGPTR
jgi:predicted metalloprotease with PDZ domain